MWGIGVSVHDVPDRVDRTVMYLPVILLGTVGFVHKWVTRKHLVQSKGLTLFLCSLNLANILQTCYALLSNTCVVSLFRLFIQLVYLDFQ